MDTTICKGSKRPAPSLPDDCIADAEARGRCSFCGQTIPRDNRGRLVDHSRRVSLWFDRLTDGTLVAVHQGVAAIAHPRQTSRGITGEVYRWALAGDGFYDGGSRPHGEHWSGNIACAQAAEALGVHLGVIVDGYEIAP